LIDLLAPEGVLFKVGYEAFYGYAPVIGRALAQHEAGYALDVKLHDIPRTAHAAVRALVTPGGRLLTVHALGGRAMLEAVVEAASERAAELKIPTPEIYAVTILTSIAGDELGELGFTGETGEHVMRLAEVAHRARCAGVVCSIGEVPAIKAAFGAQFGTFCPGIRPAGIARGDQKRAATPRDAREAGADYVVVGRPIVADADPRNAARAILTELAA
jgi:orotidine-5'-phosphate decarboxylase